MKKQFIKNRGQRDMLRDLKTKLLKLGVESKNIHDAESLIQDLDALNHEAALEVVEKVESFVDGVTPEPADSPVVNATVLAAMSALMGMEPDEMLDIINEEE